jgi:hypothetical protein
MRMIIVMIASMLALSQTAFATEAFEATLRSADDVEKEAAVLGFLGLRDSDRRGDRDRGNDRRRPDWGDRRPDRPGNGHGNGGNWHWPGPGNGHGGGWGNGGGYYPPPRPPRPPNYPPPYYPPHNPPYYPPHNPPSYDWSDGYVCYARGRAGTYKAKDHKSASRAQRQAMDKCNHYTVGCRPIGCD